VLTLSINDSVIMDSKTVFYGHIDVTVGRALAMLLFAKRLSWEFRDSYAFNTLYVSLLHPKLDCGGLSMASMAHTSIELSVCRSSS
jgi:hypothetical protein